MNSTVFAMICSSVVLASCTTTTLTLRDTALVPTHVAKLNGSEGVEQTALNAIRLKGPSKTGFRSTRLTEHLFSTEIIRSTPDPVIMQMRTTPYDDSLLAMPGIVLVIAGDSTTLINGTDTTRYSTPLPTGKPFLVEVHHDGAWFDVVIGHTHIGHQRTILPNTEWVLIGVPNKGSILVGDPQFNFGF